jgi:hypothetical protein
LSKVEPQPSPQGPQIQLTFNPNSLNPVGNLDNPVSDARSRNFSAPQSQKEIEHSRSVYTPSHGDVDLKSKDDPGDPNIITPKNKKKTTSKEYGVNEGCGNYENSDISSNSNKSISQVSDDGSHGKSSSD